MPRNFIDVELFTKQDTSQVGQGRGGVKVQAREG